MTDPVYSSYAVGDAVTRRSRANKIATVLSQHVRLGDCDVLDIGTGSGHIAAFLAERSASVTSVNLEDERIVSEGYRFVKVEDYRLPFDDASYDVVVSNHVIEHMPFQREHLAEIRRVLRPDGIAYLATPNRLAVIEPHHKLPFLSWLPRRAARAYMRLALRAEWDIYPLTCTDVTALASPDFELRDVVVDMLRDPARFGLDLVPALHATLRRIPRRAYRLLYPVIPSYIWILRPRDAATD